MGLILPSYNTLHLIFLLPSNLQNIALHSSINNYLLFIFKIEEEINTMFLSVCFCTQCLFAFSDDLHHYGLTFLRVTVLVVQLLLRIKITWEGFVLSRRQKMYFPIYMQIIGEQNSRTFLILLDNPSLAKDEKKNLGIYIWKLPVFFFSSVFTLASLYSGLFKFRTFIQENTTFN